jgi:hypothetical protein
MFGKTTDGELVCLVAGSEQTYRTLSGTSGAD